MQKLTVRVSECLGPWQGRAWELGTLMKIKPFGERKKEVRERTGLPAQSEGKWLRKDLIFTLRRLNIV